MAIELEHVPTVRELEKMNEGYAVAISWDKDGNPTRWRLTTLGYDYLGTIMKRNAEKRIAAGEGDWVQPPSRTLGRLANAS